MSKKNFTTIVETQRRFFSQGHTLSYDFRISQLKKLKSLILQNEDNIITALQIDLHKSTSEALVHEITFLINEIDYAIKHLARWMQPTKVATPFAFLPGRSSIYYEPYGVVLILAPWNYPFILSLSPLIGAIAAGNCAVVKPSEIAKASQQLLVSLINTHFDTSCIAAIEADAEQTEGLLEEKFDFIFYTGSASIGKKVMAAAANHLTPVVLELGGKNPCIVDETANLSYAARRIIWSKLNNAGQLCLAPDYIYVHETIKSELLNYLKQAIHSFYGTSQRLNMQYPRIINEKHFLRLKNLLQQSNVFFGGEFDPEENYISPTIVDGVTWQDAIMHEEIFGPILPIITFKHIDEVINKLTMQPKSLALYLFTNTKAIEQKILTRIPFGGGCVNDILIHWANINLPFGGIGESGMGKYHGHYSFDTFSHSKSIYKKLWNRDLKIEYPPYTRKKTWWIRKLLRI